MNRAVLSVQNDVEGLMVMDMDLERGFQLGHWQIAPLQGCFTTQGHSLHIEPKVMNVLLYLAQHSNRVVSREELLNAVWGDLVVSEEVLTRCISELRTALGDTSRQRRFIRTVPKRGYSLIVEPQPLAIHAQPKVDAAVNHTRERAQQHVPNQHQNSHQEVELTKTLATHIVAKKNMWSLLSGAPQAMQARSESNVMFRILREFFRLLRYLIQSISRILIVCVVTTFCFLSLYMLFADDHDITQLLEPYNPWSERHRVINHHESISDSTVNQASFVHADYQPLIKENADVAVMPLYTVRSAEMDSTLQHASGYHNFAATFSASLYEELNKIKNLHAALLGSQYTDSMETFSDIRRVGLELDVKTLLIGTIRVEHNKVRLIVQLVNTGNGLALWGRTYDSSIDVMSEWQPEVVSNVVSEVSSFLKSI